MIRRQTRFPHGIVQAHFSINSASSFALSDYARQTTPDLNACQGDVRDAILAFSCPRNQRHLRSGLLRVEPSRIRGFQKEQTRITLRVKAQKRFNIRFMKCLAFAAAFPLVFAAPLVHAAPYAYVASSSDTVSVIDTATNSVVTPIPVGTQP